MAYESADVLPDVGAGVKPIALKDVGVSGEKAQVIVEAGAEGHMHSTANVGTTMGQVLAANPTRKRAVLTHRGEEGSGAVWAGATGVTIGAGQGMAAILGEKAEFRSRGAIFAIAQGSPANIGVYEEFD